MQWEHNLQEAEAACGDYIAQGVAHSGGDCGARDVQGATSTALPGAQRSFRVQLQAMQAAVAAENHRIDTTGYITVAAATAAAAGGHAPAQQAPPPAALESISHGVGKGACHSGRGGANGGKRGSGPLLKLPRLPYARAWQPQQL